MADETVFIEYKSTVDNVIENSTAYTDALDISTRPDGSDDFDGRLDFISGSKLYTNLFQGAGTIYQFPYTWKYETKRLLFAAITLTNNNVNQKQSVVKADEAIDNITLKFIILNSMVFKTVIEKQL